jgi:hypothetical protein
MIDARKLNGMKVGWTGEYDANTELDENMPNGYVVKENTHSEMLLLQAMPFYKIKVLQRALNHSLSHLLSTSKLC